MSQTTGQFTGQFTDQTADQFIGLTIGQTTGRIANPEIPGAAATAPRASAPPRREGYLSARDITRRYGRFTALDRVSFSVARGEFVCVLGPSGCGKTTVLRTVAGLERQDAGSVSIGGRDVSSLPTARRNVGIVFQSYALFPNLTAAQNVAYGLRNQGMPRPDMARRVDELLALVGLSGMQGKYPAQLSGGQQQRVALARAMALAPDILLLDEPLSALDAQVRLHLRGEIKDLQERLGVTTILVTHDQEEALTMADRILVMDRGRIVQEGTPAPGVRPSGHALRGRLHRVHEFSPRRGEARGRGLRTGRAGAGRGPPSPQAPGRRSARAPGHPARGRGPGPGGGGRRPDGDAVPAPVHGRRTRRGVPGGQHPGVPGPLPGSGTWGPWRRTCPRPGPPSWGFPGARSWASPFRPSA